MNKQSEPDKCDIFIIFDILKTLDDTPGDSALQMRLICAAVKEEMEVVDTLVKSIDDRGYDCCQD